MVNNIFEESSASCVMYHDVIAFDRADQLDRSTVYVADTAVPRIVAMMILATVKNNFCIDVMRYR